jgi:eukaryotic-like serine/threonine-protein kinase
MSPEQLEGREADARSDVFAFGAVLYEMLTGKKAFTGNSQASIVGAILKDTPAPVSRVQPSIPVRVDRVVMTCLEKDADDRWQSTRDLRRELEWLAGAEADQRSGHPASRRALVPWLLAATAIAAAGVLLAWNATRPASTASWSPEMSPTCGTSIRRSFRRRAMSSLPSTPPRRVAGSTSFDGATSGARA